MKQVKQDSRFLVKMGTGTLYGSLKRMLTDGLIEEAGSLPAPQAGLPDPTRADERRRYYRLTDLGRRAFMIELQRYSQVVSIAQQRSLLPKFSLESGI